MKKTLSAKTLLLLTIICFIFIYITPGIVSDVLRLLAIILLVMAIIAFFRELGNKKNK